MQKCLNFTGYLPEKYLFSEFLGQFPALKPRVSGFDPNTNYLIMVDIVLRAQSCYINSVYAPLYVTLQH